MTFKELLQEFVNKTDAEKIQYAVKTGDFLRSVFDNDDQQVITFAAILTSVFAAADGKLHGTEAEMFGFCINREVTYDDFFKLSQGLISNDDLMKGFFEFIDGLNYENRLVLAAYGLAVMAADDTITQEEAHMVIRFLPELVQE